MVNGYCTGFGTSMVLTCYVGMSCAQTFGRSDLQRIASLMERHQYVNGQHIITQGERGDHFFIVLEVSSHLPPFDIW